MSRDDDEKKSGEFLAGGKEVLEAHKQPDPVDEFSAWVKENLRRFMRLMAKLIRFVDYWEYPWEDGSTHTLSAERFTYLVNLAVLDLFTEASDFDKARHIGFRYREIEENPQVLSALRIHPAYERLLADIKGKLVALRDGQNLEALAPFFENSAAWESAQNMFFAKKERDRIAAAAEFMDRVAPKKSRAEGGGVVVIIPPHQEAIMQRTLHLLGERAVVDLDPLISAKRVRVPELPPTVD